MGDVNWWTNPRVSALREMVAAGLPFSECARRLRTTRGSVAGAVKRHIRLRPRNLSALNGEAWRAECRRRQRDYEASRQRWRRLHPMVAREDCE